MRVFYLVFLSIGIGGAVRATNVGGMNYVSTTKAKGYFSANTPVEAANFIRKTCSKDIHWVEVPNLGQTHSSMIAEPVTSHSQIFNENSPMLVYDFSLFDAANIAVEVCLSPTQDFKKQDELKFAISIDDETPKIINMNKGEIIPDYKYADWWEQSVGDHIKIRKSNHMINNAGRHTLKIWMIDTGIVFQKFVIDAGGKRKSYLGTPESKLIQRSVE